MTQPTQNVKYGLTLRWRREGANCPRNTAFTETGKLVDTKTHPQSLFHSRKPRLWVLHAGSGTAQSGLLESFSRSLRCRREVLVRSILQLEIMRSLVTVSKNYGGCSLPVWHTEHFQWGPGFCPTCCSQSMLALPPRLKCFCFPAYAKSSGNCMSHGHRMRLKDYESQRFLRVLRLLETLTAHTNLSFPSLPRNVCQHGRGEQSEGNAAGTGAE